MALSQVGGTLYSSTALGATKAVVRAGACLVFNIHAFNSHATDVSYVQFFDALTADVTVGSTTPTFVIALAPKTGATLSMNCPRRFATGVIVACTSTATGSGAPAADALLNLDYVGG